MSSKGNKKETKGDSKSEINYCTLCKAAQIPDCGDRTPDNSGWDNAEWGVYASVIEHVFQHTKYETYEMDC